ncbi:MAG: AAA family ATPase [Hyphomicrobiales bacterium]|nr:AAA family ATPase [Hyphomicrobiales bacterium]MCC2107765.1 AAA family ATPase [Hyphomicrobiales bacterium]
MIISHVKLRNWKNFRDAEASLRDITYLIGANATGKSNFLDVFRFLRDIAKVQGGGVQKAIADRDGLTKIRCLHARQRPEIEIEVHLSERVDDVEPKWRYVLALKSEGKGANRPIVASEQVYLNEGGRSRRLLNRPDAADLRDTERLTQTSLEQIQTNVDYREIADEFSSITYLHLVPQLLKFGDFIGGRQLENDPFGQAFLERLARTPEKTRNSRLRRIQRALSKAIPQFEEIRFKRDDSSGRPHLEAKYTHHRPHAGWQREDQFSDGTLRLIALFWLLLDGDGFLLLEEPELSLNEEIVRNLPLLIDRVRRSTKRRSRQILISTHSQALLENKGIDPRGVLRLERIGEGTSILAPTSEDMQLLTAGLSAAEVLLPKAHPHRSREMAL